MRNFLTWLLLVPLSTAAQPDSTVFDDLLITALQGDVAHVLSAMDTLDDSALRPEQVRMKQGFHHRFRAIDEIPARKTTDTVVIALMDIYERYWRRALLEPAVLAMHEDALVFAVSGHLKKHVPAMSDKKMKWIRKNWNELLHDHLTSRGVYNAIGRTGALYDLLLHTVEAEVRYPITTPEDTLDVKVIFMDSVLSNGWEGYATFDTYYPGGWATNDALYCARGSYDLKSEQFAVSYVKHEGKHFADYKRFPKLEGTDLEYRAKLVELGAARESLYDLIRFFLQNSADDRLNPHAYANRCVMRDLSRQLFQQERMEDIDRWKSLPPEDIHRASTSLLLKHTAALNAAGTQKVRSVIQ